MVKNHKNLNIIVDSLNDSFQPLFSYKKFAAFFEINKETWGFGANRKARKLLNALINSGTVKEIRLDFPFRKEIRYTTQKILLLKKLQLAFPDAYYCHQTAAILHGFIDIEMTTIYLNVEQNIKSNTSSPLSQESIHQSFKNKPRITTNRINHDGHEVVILNGKNTEKLGVALTELSTEGIVNITEPDRALIDMVVRPFYSGGQKEVLNAFRKARDDVSLDKLLSLYNKLQYIYPYQQAIGFYLETAGNYTSNEIKLFEKKKFKYDFYLCNAINNPSYSKRWRIFYPPSLFNDSNS